MENQKNDNLNLLEAVVQNTEMGKNTLEQIVPMTEDTQFKAELLRQRNIYHQLNQEAHTAIEACGGTAQGQSAMAKLNTKMGIGMKTLTDKNGVPCVILRAMSDNADEDGHEVLVVKKFSIAEYVATATKIVAAMVEAL